jgi:hypothetical protein
MQIATGEAEEDFGDKPTKNQAAADEAVRYFGVATFKLRHYLACLRTKRRQVSGSMLWKHRSEARRAGRGQGKATRGEPCCIAT